ncbi:hypothetical protein VNI00_016436 [Paramarasmius palmivorus]|uniref:Uncharacterized protein n=1 Tax=Paramarasmius palmivorus TaxID=297713 RepID=A0AAW0BEU5_9AGAR
MAMLVYELGGGSLLYAFNHSPFALPSFSTIRQYRRQWDLAVCIDKPRILQIMSNIESMFGPHHGKDELIPHQPLPQERPGFVVFSWDELAIEQRFEYLDSTDEVIGGCMEHSSSIESVVVGRDTRVLEAVALAVRDGKLHPAHEATVGAVHCHRRRNYEANPLFLAATCKKRGWRDCLREIQTSMEAWKLSSFGEALNGPIMTIASDGDATRRAALYMLLMQNKVVPGDALYKYVRDLLGLNLYTGRDGTTMDFDWKHLFKRLCTLLCSAEGMLVNDTHINKVLLSEWLEELDYHDWSEETIHSLLNPNDAQDVPRAIKLLSLVIELRDLDPSEFGPTQGVTHKALSLLAEVFESLLDPFINPDMDLGDQIESLSKFVHLICALFIKNSTSFMSNQLYGDLQAMVKNAIFTVARYLDLDPEMEVFICLLGDDVLETFFGRVRMIGAHSPNCNLYELRYRMASAKNVDSIFRRHPEWEKKPRRLKLFRGRDTDHIRPERWTGKVKAKHCSNLRERWDKGRDRAITAINTYGVSGLITDFVTRFSGNDNKDFMRPDGKKYVALSNDVDHSLADINGSIEDFEKLPLEDQQLLSFNGLQTLEQEQTEGKTKEPHSIFLEIGSKKVPKRSAVRVFTDPASDIMDGNSHDRTIRVTQRRTFASSEGKDQWCPKKHNSESNNAQVFRLGDIFAAFVRLNDEQHSICLVVLVATVIRHPREGSVEVAPLGEVIKPTSEYSISGQILSLLPYEDNRDAIWVWNGEFVSLTPPKTKKTTADAPARLSNLKIVMSGSVILPLTRAANIAPEEIFASNVALHFPGNEKLPSSLAKTWKFSEKCLTTIWHQLLSRFAENVSIRTKVPVYTNHHATTVARETPIFPYQCPQRIYSIAASSTPLGTALNSDKRQCAVCQLVVPETEIQNHTGVHIWLAMHGVQEDNLVKPIDTSHGYPCGFCGGPIDIATGACRTQISSRGNKAESNCPLAYAFSATAMSKRNQGLTIEDAIKTRASGTGCMDQ